MRGVSETTLAILLIISVFVTAALTWGIASAHFAKKQANVPPVAAALTEPQKPAEPESHDSASMEELRRENARLQEEIGRMRGGANKEENERLKLVLKQALKQIAEPREVRNDALGLAWKRGFETLKTARERGGMFAGLDDSLSLASEMARFGAQAPPFLSELVMDGRADMKERETALFVLSHIRDKAALKELTKLRAPDVTELDYPYDLIELQVSSLSTAEVREFIPEINRQIAEELGHGEQAPERTEVLVTLGLVHGDRDALNLMNDPRMFAEDLSGAIGIAGEVHTPPARQFLEWLAQNSGNDRQTSQANAVLEGW